MSSGDVIDIRSPELSEDVKRRLEAAARAQELDVKQFIRASVEFALDWLYSDNDATSEDFAAQSPVPPESTHKVVWEAQARRLPDGEWGAIIKAQNASEIEVGEEVHVIVRLRDGSWRKAIGRVVKHEPEYHDPDLMCATVELIKPGPMHAAEDDDGMPENTDDHF